MMLLVRVFLGLVAVFPLGKRVVMPAEITIYNAPLDGPDLVFIALTVVMAIALIIMAVLGCYDRHKKN